MTTVTLIATLAGAPDRFVGTTDDGRFVFARLLEDGTYHRMTPATTEADMQRLAERILAGDAHLRTWPHALDTLALGLCVAHLRAAGDALPEHQKPTEGGNGT